MTLETMPKNDTQCWTRSLAAGLGLSQTAVSRNWRAFGLRPNRQKIVEAVEESAVHRPGS